MMSEPPIPLSGEAAKFWRRHFKRLKGRRILTRSDCESFAVLCLTWSKIVALSDTQPGADSYREMIQFSNLLKQYHSFAKQFGLMPRERKAAKMDTDPPKKKDEFGL